MRKSLVVEILTKKYQFRKLISVKVILRDESLEHTGEKTEVHWSSSRHFLFEKITLLQTHTHTLSLLLFYQYPSTLSYLYIYKSEELIPLLSYTNICIISDRDKIIKIASLRFFFQQRYSRLGGQLLFRTTGIAHTHTLYHRFSRYLLNWDCVHRTSSSSLVSDVYQGK